MRLLPSEKDKIEEEKKTSECHLNSCEESNPAFLPLRGCPLMRCHCRSGRCCNTSLSADIYIPVRGFDFRGRIRLRACQGIDLRVACLRPPFFLLMDWVPSRG